MATTFTKLKLSGSTDGRAVHITATATPGTLVHTAHATALDEIWMYAMNIDTTARELTVEYGGVGGVDHVKVTIPAKSGMLLVVPGTLLTNSLVVRAFAAATGVINIFGYVNRIA